MIDKAQKALRKIGGLVFDRMVKSSLELIGAYTIGVIVLLLVLVIL